MWKLARNNFCQGLYGSDNETLAFVRRDYDSVPGYFENEIRGVRDDNLAEFSPIYSVFRC
jgi:hypothetical protein